MQHWIISFIILTLGLKMSAQDNSDVLMTVGDVPVTVGEFKYIYEKNNGDKADYSEKSVNEYLDLYTKFKLKVAEAKNIKLDTSQAIQDELKGYSTQLASSFLMEKEVMDALLKEAYTRKQQDVFVKHIQIDKPRRATPEAIAEAYDQMRFVKQALEEGMAFEEAAEKYSQDSHTKNKGGELGWMTAMLPDDYYALEHAMYTLPEGSTSDIIESTGAWHIVKVEDRRPAKGQMQVAQIFIKSDVKGSSENNAARKLADEIYKKAKDGENWEKLVREYSDDNATKINGGKLPPFGIGVYQKDFEDAAFNLKQNGDIAKPVESELGFHILKRIEKIDLGSFEEFKSVYKERLRKMDRYKKKENAVMKELRNKAQLKERRELVSKIAEQVGDNFYSSRWKASTIENNATLLEMDGNKYSVKDFAKYMESKRILRANQNRENKVQAVTALYDSYVNDLLLGYAEKMLTAEYEDFKSLMREYNEGILLFEITKLNVWDKASADTTGLEEFFKNHRDDYRWKDRAKVVTITVVPQFDQEAIDIYKYAKNHSSEEVLHKYNMDEEKVQSEVAYIEQGDDRISNMEFRIGATSSLKSNSSTRSTTFMIIEDIQKSRNKTLSEARGYVIADYQDKLEKEWVEELRKKYEVDVNTKVLEKLYQ